MDSVIKRFEYNKTNKDQQDDFIIPPFLFEESKPRVVTELPFCKLNEERLPTFRKKLNCFTSDGYEVVWKNNKFKCSVEKQQIWVISLKDKNLHPSCKIYYSLVYVEKITLERPKETFLYTTINTTSSLINQNQLHILKKEH